jgi:hypothetical protein
MEKVTHEIKKNLLPAIGHQGIIDLSTTSSVSWLFYKLSRRDGDSFPCGDKQQLKGKNISLIKTVAS